MSVNMIAGVHDLYYARNGEVNTQAIGSTGPDGFELIKTFNEHFITSDQFGPETVIDSVNQGGNVILNLVLQEVKLDAVQIMLSPWEESEDAPAATTTDTGRPEAVGLIGDLACNNWGTLEIIPRANTPAETLNTTSDSGRQFVGKIEGDYREFLDSRPRFIPVTFRAYPQDFDADGDWRWWQWIAANTAP